MNATHVRAGLVDRLRRNLVGPAEPHDDDLATERLPAGESPSRWYLAGFIAPSGEPAEAQADDMAAQTEEVEGWFPDMEGAGAGDAAGDADAPDPAPARRRFLPSSLGLSAMVDGDVDALDATVWIGVEKGPR